MVILHHRIRIEKKHAPGQQFLLQRVVDVQVEKDIHTLADRASITLVALHKNTSLDTKKQLPVGTSISIELGYDTDLRQELVGFISHIESKADRLILHCMDHMYYYTKDVESKTYPKGSGPYSLQLILEELAQAVDLKDVVIGKNLTSFSYESFQRTAGPAVNTLKRIKDELSILLYVRNKTLYATEFHQPDLQTRHMQHVTYQLDGNILKSSLVYRNKEERTFSIHVKSRNEEDQPIEVIASGAPEQPIIRLNTYATAQVNTPKVASKRIELLRYHIKDRHALTTIATQALARWNYDGYEGHIETWLLPFCSYGYYVKIEDKQAPERTGTFFVEKVAISFSEQGGTRKVYLGKRKL